MFKHGHGKKITRKPKEKKKKIKFGHTTTNRKRTKKQNRPVSHHRRKLEDRLKRKSH
jgi:hypothetical protein